MRAHLHTFVHTYIHSHLRTDAADEMMKCNRIPHTIAVHNNNNSMCDTIMDIDAHSASFNPFHLGVKLQENVFKSCISFRSIQFYCLRACVLVQLIDLIWNYFDFLLGMPHRFQYFSHVRTHSATLHFPHSKSSSLDWLDVKRCEWNESSVLQRLRIEGWITASSEVNATVYYTVLCVREWLPSFPSS